MVYYFRYVRNFKKHKEELTAKLFQMYNDTVFVKKVCDNVY